MTYIDIGYLEGAGTGLERECLDEILRGKYPEHVACVIPSDLLSCDLAFHWFRQMFKLVLYKGRHYVTSLIKPNVFNVYYVPAYQFERYFYACINLL